MLTSSRFQVSIVTPCLNRVQTIGEAVDSVLQQDIEPVEHIVVDGGSTDGTLELLKPYGHLNVVSGPDSGMYEAIDKGLGVAKGEIVGFLNSDDFYEPMILKSVVEVFRAQPSLLAVMGGAVIFREGPMGQREIVREVGPIACAELPRILATDVPAFNAWFFRKTVFDMLGPLDASLRLASDREFLYRFASKRLSYSLIARRIYWYRHHSGSLTFGRGHEIQAREEEMLLARRYFLAAGIPKEVRWSARELHSRASVQLLGRQLSHGRFAAALATMARGWRFDLLWPIRLIGRVVSVLVASVAGVPRSGIRR